MKQILRDIDISSYVVTNIDIDNETLISSEGGIKVGKIQENNISDIKLSSIQGNEISNYAKVYEDLLLIDHTSGEEYYLYIDNGQIKIKPRYVKEYEYLCFTQQTPGDGATVKFERWKNKNDAKVDGLSCNIQYTSSPDDEGSWELYTENKVIELDNCQDNKVYFRADPNNPNLSGFTEYTTNWWGDEVATFYHKFIFDKPVKASGNVQSLITFDGKTINVTKFCFYKLFAGCSTLLQAPELKATELETDCYECMFLDCTSLTQAPELKVDILTNYCYFKMFMGCTSLLQAPALNSKLLAECCYNNMFRECSSLITIPELPARTLPMQSYYEMFLGCTSLSGIPNLPATELDYDCYTGMFDHCENITQANMKSNMETVYDPGQHGTLKEGITINYTL